MKSRLLTFAIILIAALSSACAQFEQILSTPSSDIASLLGTWTSSSSIGAGVNSCKNFQWKLTGQQGSAITGEFSAICDSLPVAGTVSGQLNGSEVAFQINGSATLSGGVPCSASVTGTARLDGDTIRVPYSGTTCFGPTQGEEVLRRSVPSTPAPTAAPAPAPTPAPEPAPVPTGSVFHVAPGPLTSQHAEHVVNATCDEFRDLLAPRPTEAEGVAAAAELLRRVIWHLHLAGFDAGRQRNPSGVISSDKLTILIGGTWRAFDIFKAVATPNQATEVIFLEVFGANTVADGGIPD